MSFTTQLKTEILNKEFAAQGENIAFITALLVNSGKLDENSDDVTLSSDNYDLIKAFNDALFKGFGGDYEINFATTEQGIRVFAITTSNKIMRKLMLEHNIILHNGLVRHKNYDLVSALKTDNQRKAYIIGTAASLIAVTVPQASGGERYTGGYHCEMSFSDSKLAGAVALMLKYFGVEVKRLQRANEHVLYIKDSSMICDMLALCAANNAVLEINNIIVARDVSNNVNRTQNCSLANMDKSIEAAQKQLIAINKIVRTIGLGSLQEKLRSIAQLRLHNPEFSLEEIATELDEPISKSGINHRFRKIMEIADNIKEE